MKTDGGRGWAAGGELGWVQPPWAPPTPEPPAASPNPSKLFRRRNNFSFVFTFNHKIILVPRTLPLGGTFVRDDISLIKCFSFGAWFFFPPRPPRSLPSSPGRLAARLPAHAGFWSLPRCAPPCSGAVIDILIRRQEAADQVLPRRGLEAARSANWSERRRHVPQQQ